MTTHDYTTPLKVAKLIWRDGDGTDFDGSSSPTKEIIENHIRRMMDHIDRKTNHSWRPRRIYDEHHFVERSRVSYFQRRTPLYLPHRKIRPLVSGTHKIERFDGNVWEDLVANSTEGYAADYYIDYVKGILYFIDEKPYIGYDPNIRLTYDYGGIDTAINDGSGINESVTSITVDSTKWFPPEGTIRINDEEIHYTGLTATTITGCTRGANETTATSHSDDDGIVYIPEDIEYACTALVAAEITQSDDYTKSFPDGLEGVKIREKGEIWRQEANAILAGRGDFHLVSK